MNVDIISDWFVNVKSFLIGVIISICSYLNPISGDMNSLLYLFACNFLFGLLADIIIRKKGFNLKKAFRAVTEAMIFFIIVASIYYIGERKDDATEAIQCISFVTYSIVYFYAVNILRNIKQILKNDSTAYKVVSFLYYILTIEFIKKIPYLKDWIIEHNNKHKDENNNN